MFSQNPAQALTIRFVLILVLTGVLFNAVQPVFAATELALAGYNINHDINHTRVVDMVTTLQPIGEVGRKILELVSTFVR